MPPITDAAYFVRRAAESRVAMHAAKDSGSRLVHAQLAAAYEALVRSTQPMGLAPPLEDNVSRAGSPGGLAPAIFARMPSAYEIVLTAAVGLP